MKLIQKIQLLAVGLVGLSSLWACDDFVFGKVSVTAAEKKHVLVKTPTSGADIYYGTQDGQQPLPTTNVTLHNPDPKGALADWYNCLVMFKEGHNHTGGKMHGNNVATHGLWRQEQFAEVRNTESGQLQVMMNNRSIRNFLEEEKGITGPDYFRLIGGSSKMWACCLFFYDKQGRLLNDSILKHSDQYQIFYSISDLDEHNRPYAVMDVRQRKGMSQVGVIEGVPAHSFKGKDSFEARRQMSRSLFKYVYRDTWTQNEMGDGVRNFFNIKLLPPLTRKSLYEASVADQDCVGLKGHFTFTFADPSEGLDPLEWPMLLSENSWNRHYRRSTFLLPKFCLAVRLMKCAKGKKAIIPSSQAKGGKACAAFDSPAVASEWQEVIRFNLPIKVFCSTYDSDPTNDDPYEPLYYHLGREFHLSPVDAYEGMRSNTGGRIMEFDAWFL